ncbi:MAG TPA: hypothetical protein VJA40_04260 [archaeon]|nr:hypothetical protein [archaeon]
MVDVLPFEKGPWTKLMESQFSGFSVSIYQNPEKWALTVVYVKDGDKTTHVVTQVYAPFTANGNVIEFSRKMKSDSIAMHRQASGKGYQYFVVMSGTSYTAYETEGFKREVESQLEGLAEKIDYAQKVSRAYGVTLTALGSSEKDAEAAFFGDPIIGPILSTKPMEARLSERIGKVSLGLDVDGNKFELPGLLFKRSLVHGGAEKNRNHAAHVLIEGFLLSGIPVIVFDWDNSFSSLSLPSESQQALKKYKVELEPSGFPVKTLNVPEDAHVEIATTPVEAWKEMVGYGNAQAGRIIEEVMNSERENITRLQEIQARLREKYTEDNGFNVRRAIRIIELVKKRHDSYFNGSVDPETVLVPWTEFLGRAGVVNLNGVPEEIGRNVAHSVLKSMLQKLKEKGTSTKLRGVVVLPKADFACPEVTDALARETIELLLEVVNYGGAYVLLAQDKNDVSGALREGLDSELNVIVDNQAAIRQADGKVTRLMLRPSLSKCGANEEFKEAESKAE